MNIEDIYYDFPEIQTDMEKLVNSDNFSGLHDVEPEFLFHTRSEEVLPDGVDQDDFRLRQPAFGWTASQLQELESRAAESHVHEYVIYESLKSMMLRRLIVTSGAGTVRELCDILRQEKDSGQPGAIPDWYVFSDESYGHDYYGKKRRFGYKQCEHRECTQTEDLQVQFKQCINCKMACYCSRKCQVADWKARHKKVCARAKKEGDEVNSAASFIQMFQR